MPKFSIGAEKIMLTCAVFTAAKMFLFRTRLAQLPANLPSIGEIFHWDVEMPELNHYVSSSDFERIVTGKLTIDGFKSTLRGSD